MGDPKGTAPAALDLLIVIDLRDRKVPGMNGQDIAVGVQWDLETPVMSSQRNGIPKDSASALDALDFAPF
jgi:hypothetical protein